MANKPLIIVHAYGEYFRQFNGRCVNLSLESPTGHIIDWQRALSDSGCSCSETPAPLVIAELTKGRWQSAHGLVISEELVERLGLPKSGPAILYLTRKYWSGCDFQIQIAKFI